MDTWEQLLSGERAALRGQQTGESLGSLTEFDGSRKIIVRSSRC